MFSILTEPSYPKAAIGLERESVTALALQKEGRGQYGVRQAATIEMPVGLLNPSFTEKNIASPEQFRVILEEAVSTAGLSRQKNWSISLPSGATRSAILHLEPGATEAGDLSEVLDWKAEQSFGTPAGDLRISRFKISDDQAGRSRYFASAVKLSVIDEFETVFESLGWKSGLVLPRAVSEAGWLARENSSMDSLLISSQSDGFTAFLLRGPEVAVVRSVTCTERERDDEIYRLLMFYRDRFAGPESAGLLDRLLAIGKGLVPNRLKEISAEALGSVVSVLSPEDVGLNIPVGSLRFDEIAAPAALAKLGYR
jgi:hypothetical protein